MFETAINIIVTAPLQYFHHRRTIGQKVTDFDNFPGSGGVGEIEIVGAIQNPAWCNTCGGNLGVIASAKSKIPYSLTHIKQQQTDLPNFLLVRLAN